MDQQLENDIKEQVVKAAEELIREARYTRPGDLFVLGCSTSEVMGEVIGQGSERKDRRDHHRKPFACHKKHKLHLAVQGCEHINRSSSWSARSCCATI